MDASKRALHIYGVDMKSFKEKMTQRTPTVINNVIVTTIPPAILDLHQTINFSTDYFFVQGITFLQMISRGYTFRVIEHLKKFNKQ